MSTDCIHINSYFTPSDPFPSCNSNLFLTNCVFSQFESLVIFLWSGSVSANIQGSFFIECHNSAQYGVIPLMNGNISVINSCFSYCYSDSTSDAIHAGCFFVSGNNPLDIKMTTVSNCPNSEKSGQRVLFIGNGKIRYTNKNYSYCLVSSLYCLYFTSPQSGTGTIELNTFYENKGGYLLFLNSNQAVPSINYFNFVKNKNGTNSILVENSWNYPFTNCIFQFNEHTQIAVSEVFTNCSFCSNRFETDDECGPTHSFKHNDACSHPLPWPTLTDTPSESDTPTSSRRHRKTHCDCQDLDHKVKKRVRLR
jgi:hypothetical protein